jgi:hypothetical protein
MKFFQTLPTIQEETDIDVAAENNLLRPISLYEECLLAVAAKYLFFTQNEKTKFKLLPKEIQEEVKYLANELANIYFNSK